MNKIVEIEVEEGKKLDSGKPYTSVDFMASTYGGASPCDTDEEVSSTVKHFTDWIKREGDIPKLVDKRKKATLMAYV